MSDAMFRKLLESTRQIMEEDFGVKFKEGQKVRVDGEVGTIVGMLKPDEYKVEFPDGEVGDYHAYDIEPIGERKTKRMGGDGRGRMKEGKAPSYLSDMSGMVREELIPMVGQQGVSLSPEQWDIVFQTAVSILKDHWSEFSSYAMEDQPYERRTKKRFDKTNKMGGDGKGQMKKMGRK